MGHGLARGHFQAGFEKKFIAVNDQRNRRPIGRAAIRRRIKNSKVGFRWIHSDDIGLKELRAYKSFNCRWNGSFTKVDYPRLRNVNLDTVQHHGGRRSVRLLNITAAGTRSGGGALCLEAKLLGK